MSKASEYARKYTENRSPSFNGSAYLEAFVNNGGCLSLRLTHGGSSTDLTTAAALAFGRWLVETFGEGA